MTDVAYRIFYDFDGMLRGDPLHTRLTESEEAENIKRLPFDLNTMLDDENATVTIEISLKGENILFIRTTDHMSIVEERLKTALRSLYLFGKQQESTAVIDVR